MSENKKINFKVGDKVQWYPSTSIYSITKTDNIYNKVYYNHTENDRAPQYNYMDILESNILNGKIHSYIPVEREKKPIKKESKKKMENKIITNADVRSVINKSNGQIFTVAFRKRSNGELRIMNARLGVQKDLTGKGMSYNPKSHGLMTVFDMQKQEYRMVDTEAVIWAKVNGTTYTVDRG